MLKMCFQSGKSGNRHCCTVATWQLQSFDKSLQLATGICWTNPLNHPKTLAFCKLPMPMQSLPSFFEWFKLVQVGSSWFKHKNICFNHQPTNIANVCTCSMYHPSLSHCHGCHEIFPGHVLNPSRGPSWRGLLQHLSLHRFWSSTRNLGALGSGDLYVNLKLSDEHPDCDWCFSKDKEDINMGSWCWEDSLRFLQSQFATREFHFDHCFLYATVLGQSTSEIWCSWIQQPQSHPFARKPSQVWLPENWEERCKSAWPAARTPA